MINLKASLSILLLTLLTVGVSTADSNIGPLFGYTGGNNGPEKWGNLNPSYSTCKTGKNQSPVDIVKSQVARSRTFKSLTRIYNPCNATLINNGFNVGIHVESDAGVMVVDGKNYTLEQMHWHSPSEHRLNGVQYPMELHLVHKAGDGSTSVVGILYQYGSPDPFLAKIKDELEELAKETCAENEEAHIGLGTMDLKLLQKQTRKFFRYVGSFTTPPCSEPVVWNVLARVRNVAKDQVEALKAPLSAEYKNNSRPLQPLNGRRVELYAEVD
ncbi:hypothetical protein FNV43_RR15565 [Rhamnella rubrinervis]|uniref:Carbonic anhydrase n=1 Tax=Rhamnella rubrinervis TaxID=2594499 RepID=A0A8K0E208_9ROSA|nr:hypothetical protein FNV43_RR15565 [Rhamnella rubrinervis]